MLAGAMSGGPALALVPPVPFLAAHIFPLGHSRLRRGAFPGALALWVGVAVVPTTASGTHLRRLSGTAVFVHGFWAVSSIVPVFSTLETVPCPPSCRTWQYFQSSWGLLWNQGWSELWAIGLSGG